MPSLPLKAVVHLNYLIKIIFIKYFIKIGNYQTCLPPNSENLRYLNPGRCILLLSSSPGLIDFPKVLEITFLYLETAYFPAYRSCILSS